MSVITNKWNDGSGDSINIESPSFQGNQTVKISSPVQKGTSKRSMKFIGKCKKDSSKQVILTVEQEASTYTYDLTLNSDNTEIAAKGGTATITVVLKTYRNGNLVSTDNVTPVLSGSATGFSISGTKVTASNRTTTVGSRRSIVVTGKYSNTFDGQTVSSTITIYQEANEASYGALTGGSVLASDIPASGGTSSTSISNMSQTISYTSGSTRAGTVTYSKTSEITVSSLGTTVKARTKVGQVTVTYTGEGGATANKTVDIYQAENTVSYSDITITKETPINLSAAMHINIKVSDGLSYSQKATYTSGATTDITTGANTTYSVQNPVTGFTLSNNILSVTSNKSLNPRNGFVVRINILLNGKTAIKDITYNQAAGYYTYANPVVTLTCNDVPASGGSVKTGNVTYSQTYGWNGVTTGAGVITEGEAYISWSGGVDNIPSLGTTVKSRTKVGVLGVTVNINGKSGNTTVYIYQAENKVTNSNYNPRITAYGTPTISIGSGLTAAGGSATVSASVTNTETYNALYSSGAIGPNQTRSVGGSLSISMTVNGNSRFSLSGNTITHSSMGTNETTDTVTIKAVNDGDSSKSATASKSITNSKTVKSTSGGVYTYGDVIAGTVTNGIIPASGGSATAKAGNGTQSWNKSATVTTYEYTSGATKDVTTEAASSGTANVVPNVASITATASSKGTTVSAQTTVKSQAVTWSANGKSASGTIYIYQAANKIDSYNYSSWNIAVSANPTTIAASGGTSTITASCTRTKTPVYTSGSTGIATTESATPTLAISGTGFTLSGTTVTASKNNVASRTATVTASYSGATSKSVTITQSAGPDGIGYMQIQGDGVDHYIFQVGRTPNTRSNDVQTLSEEPVEVAVETKSESLFAKIKRIVTNLN